DVLALRDQVLARLVAERRAVMAERRDHDLALALRVLAERNLAIDLGDDRVVLRLPCLKELGDTRETTGDVLGLRRFARDLADDVARLEEVAILDDDVRADREEVTRLESRVRELEGLSGLGVFERNAWTEIRSAGLDDHLAREARDLVELFDHRDTFD